DKTLPKGANIIIAIININRNDKYWPNPLKFDPERFLREDTKHSQYYIPFSDGPRNYIGDKTLPKDANIIIAIIHIHRNDKYWPNPLKFDPERFLREDIKHSQYYIPFSDGPRNYI
ncbi:PREDICTED: cytochrome P450 6B1-like, partial [Vollenhovia emeryi]|uniref:cytochrome P450 6B1-like n=1 Tax=Vollenhovia emeryi TaxID=411798 RepID=UPI0005F5811A